MIVPAAVPIEAALVIVELSLVPASLIVPLFNAIAFAPIDSTSSASVAALPAAIVSENTNSLVPVPEAYDNEWLAFVSLTTVRVGVPPDVSTSTGSLNLALTCRVPPSDLSNAVVMNSISVMSAAPRRSANPQIATRPSGCALVLSLPLRAEPASRTQPLALANTCFFWAVVRFLGFDSSESVAPHKGIFFSL